MIYNCLLYNAKKVLLFLLRHCIFVHDDLQTLTHYCYFRLLAREIHGLLTLAESPYKYSNTGLINMAFSFLPA